MHSIRTRILTLIAMAIAAPALASSEVVAEGCSGFDRTDVSASISYDHAEHRFALLLATPDLGGPLKGMRFDQFFSAARVPKPRLFDAKNPLVLTSAAGQVLKLMFGTKSSVNFSGSNGVNVLYCEWNYLSELQVEE